MSHRLRFCSDCPDHEACATGAPCHTVRDLAPPCPACHDLLSQCQCPRFQGERNMECRSCGALQGQHLVRYDEVLVCPVMEEIRGS